ncbi:MAG: hypothetical protein WCO18_01530 [bacterium]
MKKTYKIFICILTLVIIVAVVFFAGRYLSGKYSSGRSINGSAQSLNDIEISVASSTSVSNAPVIHNGDSPTKISEKFVSAFASEDWKTMDSLSSKILFKTLSVDDMKNATKVFGPAKNYVSYTESLNNDKAETCGEFVLNNDQYSVNISFVTENDLWKIGNFRSVKGATCGKKEI